MYYKLESDELKTIDRVSNITCTDYELLGNFVPVESMVSMIEDLLLEIDRLQEKYEDLEQNLEENYKPIPVSEQYGVSDRDFL